MTENQRETTSHSQLSKWSRWLFTLSVGLLGVICLLHGFGIIQFPEKEKQVKAICAGGLRCDEPVWNFGAIDSVKIPRLTHEFVLFNESKETVNVEKVHSTCGCMVAEGYDKEISPGKTTKLRVDVQLPPTPGMFHKSLAVQLGGAKTSVMPLDVVGETIANSSMYSVPAKVNFGVIHPGEAKERIVQVYRYDLSPIFFREAKGSDEHLICQVEPLETHEEHKIKLRVRLTAEELSTGRYEGSITIKTGNMNNPEMKVPVSIIVIGTKE